MADSTIEVDPTEQDSHSDYESSGAFSTESLTSSIYEYRYENGRRYHAYQDGKYVVPNDEKEQDRLDIVHHICLLMLDSKLHLAPIGDNPQKILDVGTGTGVWAIDCGELYPSAQVIGIDLSPIQPNWVPPNVQFQVEDAEIDWTWPENDFDFIHIRQLNGAIADWQALVDKAYKHLKPGGWLELNEYEINLYSDDGSLTEDSNTSRYFNLIYEASTTSGRPCGIAPIMRPFLENAGFENIESKMYKLPLGSWPIEKAKKQLGAYFMLVAETGFEAYGVALLTRVLKIPMDEVNKMIAGVKHETKDKRIHSYAKQFIYYGQKPEEV